MGSVSSLWNEPRAALGAGTEGSDRERVLGLGFLFPAQPLTAPEGLSFLQCKLTSSRSIHKPENLPAPILSALGTLSVHGQCSYGWYLPARALCS